MRRTTAAVGIDHEVTRVEPALHRHLPHEIGHVKFHDLCRAAGCLDHVHLQPVGYLLHGAQRAVLIKDEFATEEVSGIQVAKDQIGVGDGRLLAAAVIARRTGVAPAECGPTFIVPLSSSIQMMLPPPLPMDWISSCGMKKVY